MSDAKPRADTTEAVVIKKYANRRLYNTANSSYVTLEHLSEMVRSGVDFVVQDAKSGEDITRSVLTQIIFEQESRGENLLPVKFLRRLIRFYGDSMQGFLPAYLEMSMETFAKSQEQLRDQWSRTWGASMPVAAFDETARQNMAMFQQAMRMWAPYQGGPGATPDDQSASVEDDGLDDLRKQMELMQKQIEALSAARKP